MRFLSTLAAGLLAGTVATLAQAADLPASACQIFIKKVGTAPSSHGSASLPVIVKVGWLGNGEMIERVGFYGYTVTQDLGNAADCRLSPAGDGQWRIIDATSSTWNTEFGDYAFSFPVRSGSVLSQCPGFHYSSVGTFFVQTSANTYWLNPWLDSSQLFHFDDNGYDILQRQVGTFNLTATDRDDLRYYNPLVCR